MPSKEICFMTAVEMVDCIRSGDLSVRQIMSAHLDQVERINPQVNAIVTFLPDQAMKQATNADEAISQRKDIGDLHGLPVA
ncbi:TPA: amidase, partial [Candidatus Poribacteria bacterium]|nr:amidase [Candidatus Poribacteria bacterium]